MASALDADVFFVAANLSLMSNLPQPDSTLQFIDAFADETKRLDYAAFVEMASSG